jgi:hypothetical protein
VPAVHPGQLEIDDDGYPSVAGTGEGCHRPGAGRPVGGGELPAAGYVAHRRCLTTVEGPAHKFGPRVEGDELNSDRADLDCEPLQVQGIPRNLQLHETCAVRKGCWR